MEISRWCQPPDLNANARSPGGATEWRRVISTAPAGACAPVQQNRWFAPPFNFYLSLRDTCSVYITPRCHEPRGVHDKL